MKNKNMKNCLCVLSVICCLSASQVYAQESLYTDEYIQKSVQQKITDNFNSDYSFAVEMYFYNLLNDGKYKEALDTINYLIAADKSFYGEDLSQTGFAYLGKGRYYLHLGIYNLGKQNLDKAFEVCQKNINDWDLRSNSIYGLIYFYSETEMPYEALKYLDMLTINELNPPTLAQKYLEYGNAYTGLKHYDKALDYYNKYYKEQIKSDEDNSLTKYNYYSYLASLYQNKSDYLLFYDYLLKAEEELNNIENVDADTRILLNMSKFQYYMDTKDYENAKKLLDELKIITDKYGKDYRKDNINSMYFAYFKDMKDKNSIEKYLKEIKKPYKNYPSDSLKYLNYAENRINSYRDFGQTEDADKFLLEVLNKLSKVQEYTPALYGKYLRKAFELKMQENETEEAKNYLDKSFEIYSKVLPAGAFEFYDLYKNYAEFYERKGDNSEALNYYNKAIEINSALQGRYHKDIADLYNNLSNIYRNLGETQKAVDYMDKAVEIYKKSYGENNIQVYEKLLNKYHLYNNIGEHIKAKSLLEEINADFEDNLAKGQSLDLYLNLNITNGYNELANKNYENALNYARKAMEYAKYKNDKNSVYELFYNIYKENGKSVKAYKYKKLGHIEQ